jgi:5-aminopentanamidase
MEDPDAMYPSAANSSASISDGEMSVALVQFAPAYLDPDANRERVRRLLTGVSADLVVVPELFTSGYYFRSEDDVDTVSEEVPGPTSEALSAWAREMEAVIVAGFPEREGGKRYNSAVIVSPDGVEGTYRKVHLFNEEKRWFEPGNKGFDVYDFTTVGGTAYTLGVMICFDWYFPESARTLALKGADIIAHPSNLVLPHCPNSMPIRARENHVFTVTANRYGEETKEGDILRFIGESSMCAPNGDVIHRAAETGDEVFVTPIRPSAARERSINAYNDIFADRKPDAYAL